MIVAAIAVAVIPGGFGLSAAMIGSIKMAGISAALGLAAGILGLGPKPPKTSPTNYDRLQANADPTAPRKIVFGNTAMAVDIRHQEWSAISSNPQGILHRVFFHASHKVQSIDEIWLDDRLAWSNGTTQSFYIDSSGSHQATYFTATTRLEGTPGNTIAINGGAKWGSSRRCTGIAYSYMTFRVIGANVKDKPTESPFSGGVPSRMTVRGKGAYVYDPRQDSTVGGSGSHRANDQTTWLGIGETARNPALQILWYLLGWRIQNPADGTWKLALGRGIPPSRIDMASFIAAANVCDETVTSSVNGTEPRYRSDGVFSENDDPNLVLDSLKAACNGDVRDFGGIISLHIRKNDLAIVSCQLSEDDILGGFVWKQTPDLDETFNEVRGRYVDPSNQSLYLLRDYPPVRIEPIDNIERAEPFDLPTVQSISQAQRIAKGRLARNLYRGTFSAEFNARAWAAGVGKIVELSIAPLGWANKKFRVLEMGVRVDGVVPMLLQEEHADVYLWDDSDVPGVAPLVPTSYDPSLAPARVVLDSLQPGATRNVWKGDWVGGVDYLVGDLVMVGGVVYEAILDHTSVVGQPPPNANWALWFATSADPGISATITKPAHTVSATWDGIVSDYTGAGGNWQVMAGSTDVTAQFLPITTVANPVTLDTSYVGSAYAVTGSFDAAADTADLTMRVTGTGSFVGISFDRTFTLTKIRAQQTMDTTPPAQTVGLSLSSSIATLPDGTQQATLSATWTASVATDLAYYIVSARVAGGGWVEYIVGSNAWSAPVIAGVNYEVFVRAVDISGNKGTASTTSNLTIAGDTTAPGAPTSPSATASFQNIFLSWTNPTATDMARVQVWENTTNNSGTATLIATVNGQSGQKGGFTRSGLATGALRYYWLKAVDYSGNASGFTTVVSATTASVPAVDISGVLLNAQIDSLAASKITGQLSDAQLAAIAAAKITGQITTTQITDDAITTPKINAGAVTSAEIAADTIVAGNIAASAITSTELAAGAVIAGKIAAGTIVAADIAAATITGDKIAANTITAADIAAGTITSAEIAAGTIVADDIQAGSLTGDRFATNTSLPGTITVGVTGVTIETVRANSTAGRAGNILPNSDFYQNMDGWSLGGVYINGGRDYPSADWRPIPEHTIGMAQGLPAVGSGYIMGPLVKVNPGEWIEAQALIAAHRCTAGLNLKFYDEATSVETGNSFLGFQTVGNGGQQLATWTPQYTKMQVPAGSSYARLIIEKSATNAGQTDSYVWVTRPLLGLASAAQTSASPFQHSGAMSVSDPIALANTKSTMITPGLVQISGATTLSSWRNGGDNTKIEGGSIAANTITANKMVIGSRGINITGIEFEHNSPSTNQCSWTAGWIIYTNDSGTVSSVNISAGSVTWSGNLQYLYWVPGNSTIWAHTDPQYAHAANAVKLATYNGGTDLIVNYGRTIIDGSDIKTGTVSADRIVANSIGASQLTTGVLISQTSQLGDATVTSLKIAGGNVIVPQVTEGTLNTYIPDTGASVEVMSTGTVTVGDSNYGAALVEMQADWDGTVIADAYMQAKLEVSINGGAWTLVGYCTMGCRTNNGSSYPYIPFKAAYIVGGSGGSAVSTIAARMICLSVQLGGAAAKHYSYVRRPIIVIQGGKR